jgi:hypothetical protein
MATGCMATGAGMTDSTTPLDGKSYTVIGKADGSAWGIMILGIPFSELKMTENAIARAKADAKADGLIDVCMDNVVYNLGPIVIVRTHVMGKAIKIKP